MNIAAQNVPRALRVLDGLERSICSIFPENHLSRKVIFPGNQCRDVMRASVNVEDRKEEKEAAKVRRRRNKRRMILNMKEGLTFDNMTVRDFDR